MFYLTFAAAAYLALFCFIQNRNRSVQRRALVWMGLALGLCAASKLLIPAVAFALVLGFVFGSLVVERPGSGPAERGNEWIRVVRNCASALALVGGVSGLAYFANFLPNYWFGWWRGLGDQLGYYHREFEIQSHFTTSGHPYASPWWSWPLMLRSILYWSGTNFFSDPTLPVGSIRALGNPIIWWGVVGSIPLAACKAVVRRDRSLMFIVLGYAAYLAMWIPIHRYQFIYYYMPSLYLGFFALAANVVETARNQAARWEPSSLLSVVVVALLLGVGVLPGLAITLTLGSIYFVLRAYRPRQAGRFVAALFVLAVVTVFMYFFPIWTGIPVTTVELRRRMWLHGPGLANWI